MAILLDLCRWEAWTHASSLLSSLPPTSKLEQIATLDRNGTSPLHWACCSAPVSLLEMFLEAAPESPMVRNNDGKLPLHSAAYFHNDVKFIKLLIRTYPDGLTMNTSDNKQPVKIAVGTDHGRDTMAPRDLPAPHAEIKALFRTATDLWKSMQYCALANQVGESPALRRLYIPHTRAVFLLSLRGDGEPLSAFAKLAREHYRNRGRDTWEVSAARE